MPSYKKKFSAPAYHEEQIVDEEGNAVGTIRVKPSSVLWKPKGQQRFFSVPLDKFTKWITNRKTAASRTTR